MDGNMKWINTYRVRTSLELVYNSGITKWNRSFIRYVPNTRPIQFNHQESQHDS